MAIEEHTISLLVNNQPGVLSRIAGVFSSRGYNIRSLCVAETTNPEISRITLEDISPQKAEITLPHRKGHNPITLPLPENTLKAIAAYLSRGRPRSPSRTLFVSLQFPYGPMHPSRLSQSISTAMRRAGLSGTAYSLRHTYAQNLLQMGHSIYEIKEMLGHDRVHSTQRYLHIHVELIREVLFHETL